MSEVSEVDKLTAALCGAVRAAMLRSSAELVTLTLTSEGMERVDVNAIARNLDLLPGIGKNLAFQLPEKHVVVAAIQSFNRFLEPLKTSNAKATFARCEADKIRMPVRYAVRMLKRSECSRNPSLNLLRPYMTASTPTQSAIEQAPGVASSSLFDGAQQATSPVAVDSSDAEPIEKGDNDLTEPPMEAEPCEETQPDLTEPPMEAEPCEETEPDLTEPDTDLIDSSIEAEPIEEIESSGSPPHEPPFPELVQDLAGSTTTVDVSKQRKEPKPRSKKDSKKKKKKADSEKQKPESDEQTHNTDTAKKQKTDTGSKKQESDSNQDHEYQVHRMKKQGVTIFCVRPHGCTKQVLQVTEKKAGSVEKAQALAVFLSFLANTGMSLESVKSLKSDLLDGKEVDVNGKHVCLQTLPCSSAP